MAVPDYLQAQNDFIAKYPTIAARGFNTSAPNMGYYTTLQDLEKANGLYVPPVAPPDLHGLAIAPAAATPSASFDPLLSPTNILKQANDATELAKTPVDPSKFIVPGAQELLVKGVNDQLNVNRATVQSDATARGITGSSTEWQTLNRDLPAAANQALAEGTVKLLQAAYPLAIQEKQNILDSVYKTASLTAQIRTMVGDEQFKQLSLDQQKELANQDVNLKLALADIEMKFQTSLKQAEMAFQSAENEKDRAAAQAQFQYLKDERKKAQQGAFISSLTTLAGIGIALGTGPAGMEASALMTRAAAGGMAGQAAGNGFAGLFMTK